MDLEQKGTNLGIHVLEKEGDVEVVVVK